MQLVNDQLTSKSSSYQTRNETDIRRNIRKSTNAEEYERNDYLFVRFAVLSSVDNSLTAKL